MTGQLGPHATVCKGLSRQAVDFDPDSLRKIMPAAVKVVVNAMDAGKKCAVHLDRTALPRITYTRYKLSVKDSALMQSVHVAAEYLLH